MTCSRLLLKRGLGAIRSLLLARRGDGPVSEGVGPVPGWTGAGSDDASRCLLTWQESAGGVDAISALCLSCWVRRRGVLPSFIWCICSPAKRGMARRFSSSLGGA